jgi:NAD-dependent deacetylase
MSAESGLKTFRDANGLWEGHDVYTVASPQGWAANRRLVLEFYNQRRVQLGEATPNAGHLAVAALEKDFDVEVITQNVDDLHERAGSSRVLHLHGKLVEVRSAVNPGHIVNVGYRRLEEGELCPHGQQLRPNIVWFGEDVPLISEAARLTAQADVLVVIGTSLQVYPAAGLIHLAPALARKFLIDPRIPREARLAGFECIEAGAGEGMKKLVSMLTE